MVAAGVRVDSGEIGGRTLQRDDRELCFGGGRQRRPTVFFIYFQDWLGSGRHLVVQGCVQAWCERADMADGAGGRASRLGASKHAGVTDRHVEIELGHM